MNADTLIENLLDEDQPLIGVVTFHASDRLGFTNAYGPFRSEGKAKAAGIRGSKGGLGTFSLFRFKQDDKYVGVLSGIDEEGEAICNVLLTSPTKNKSAAEAVAENEYEWEDDGFLSVHVVPIAAVSQVVTGRGRDRLMRTLQPE